jgi:hypothetical protein
MPSLFSRLFHIFFADYANLSRSSMVFIILRPNAGVKRQIAIVSRAGIILGFNTKFVIIGVKTCLQIP